METVRISVNRRAGESGVALRLPPQMFSGLQVEFS
jgi:hypothetical protein